MVTQKENQNVHFKNCLPFDVAVFKLFENFHHSTNAASTGRKSLCNALWEMEQCMSMGSPVNQNSSGNITENGSEDERILI